MNMSKIMPVLFLPALCIPACTKTVTQVVNQAFSASYQIQAGSWATTDGGLSYSTTLSVPEINSVVLQSGAVIVYLSLDGGTTFEALPEVFNGVAYGAIHQNQTIYLDISAANGTSTVTPPNKTYIAKVVLVNAKPL